jgi:hypothetical protein
VPASNSLIVVWARAGHFMALTLALTACCAVVRFGEQIKWVLGLAGRRRTKSLSHATSKLFMHLGHSYMQGVCRSANRWRDFSPACIDKLPASDFALANTYLPATSRQDKDIPPLLSQARVGEVQKGLHLAATQKPTWHLALEYQPGTCFGYCSPPLAVLLVTQMYVVHTSA